MRSKKAPFMDLSRGLLSRIKSFSNDLFRNLSKARNCPELVVCFEFPRDKSPNITIKIRTDISHPRLISPRNTASSATTITASDSPTYRQETAHQDMRRQPNNTNLPSYVHQQVFLPCHQTWCLFFFFILNIMYLILTPSPDCRGLPVSYWASDREIHHIFAGERSWTSLVVRTPPAD